jgi:hypothetical protein
MLSAMSYNKCYRCVYSLEQVKKYVENQRCASVGEPDHEGATRQSEILVPFAERLVPRRRSANAE